MDKDTGIAKSYLNLLVDEIVVTEKTAKVIGRYSALVATARTKEIKKGRLETST
ncbi:MAG: hypothetical protein Q8M99_02625 [Methylotenera sp.]|nr:hypothetical protein [Methylotenera sp.]